MESFHTLEKQDRVLLALSGGVDSSVACAILMQMGFEVEAAVIRFSPAHDGAVEAARTAARQLGVPLHVLEGGDAFRQAVIEPFCEGYCRGETPNPCIQCNPAVKFRLLTEKADELGCGFVATGHYARVEQDADGVTRVHTAESGARDQTYMLYRLGAEVLERLCLPLGEFEKEDVREMAREMGLACADAPDSMEICFIPDGDYAAWLDAHGTTPPPGNFVDRTGKVLGQHKGIHHYTIGQRRGLSIPAGHRLFVSEIRPQDNTVILSDGSDLMADRVWGEDLNLLADLAQGDTITVRLRHSKQEHPAIFHPIQDGAMLELLEPARAPTPGQLAVFYQGDTVLGSMWITSARRILPE